MIKVSRLLKAMCVMPWVVLPFLGTAQTVSDPTPRQSFVSLITGIPVEDIQFETRPPVPVETPIDTPETLPEPEQTVPPPPQSDTRPPLETDTHILPFYLKADDYLKARGNSSSDQIILDYEVTPINVSLGLSANPKSVRLVIGPDFAAITRENKTRIFDFKLRRLLTLREVDGEPVFDNTSLFPVALKNIETVRSATQNGALTEIPIGPDKSLDTFWMEASLGWSARDSIAALSTDITNSTFVATYDTTTATRLVMDGPVFLSEGMRASLFAFLHHDVAIHPLALRDLGLSVAAPSQMEVMSFSPNYPSGLNTVWTLKAAETVSGPFPLTPNTQPSIAIKQGSAVDYVIYSHAYAPNPHIALSEDDLRQRIFDAQHAQNAPLAWITAKMLETRVGGCENDPALLCKDIEDLEMNASPDSNLGKLLWALEQDMEQDGSPQMTAKALEIILEHTGSPETPAFLLKRAGILRSRLKPQSLKSPGLKSVRADRLLEEALIKNPEDAEIYHRLSQVYASQKRYTESWNLLDALRAMPDTPDTLSAPVNRVEQSLAEQAPAFFIPKSF